MCSNNMTYDEMKMNGVNDYMDMIFRPIFDCSQRLAFTSWKDVFEQLRVNWIMIAAYDGKHPKNLSKAIEMLVDENQRILQCLTGLYVYPCLRETNAFIEK